MTYEFHRIWIEQGQAVEEIRGGFGLETALGYLIGERLLRFFDPSDAHPSLEEELPKLVERIEENFQPYEIRGYLETVRRVGAVGNTCTDEELEVLRRAGAIEDEPVNAARDFTPLERAKERLMRAQGPGPTHPLHNCEIFHIPVDARVYFCNY